MKTAAAPARALVVEDDPAIAKLLCAYLSRMHFTATSTPDGEAALAYLQEHPIELVCLDLMLPNLSGFPICEAIRKMPRHRRTPVLVVSARSSPEAKAHAEEAGANGYVVKPFRRSEFEREVHRLYPRTGHAPQG